MANRLKKKLKKKDGKDGIAKGIVFGFKGGTDSLSRQLRKVFKKRKQK